MVEVVEQVLRQLPPGHQTKFARFASTFSRSAKVLAPILCPSCWGLSSVLLAHQHGLPPFPRQVNHRVFAVDLLAEILKSAWIWDEQHATATTLLSLLLSRGSDRAPTVRSRALGALSALVGAARDLVTTAPRLRTALHERYHTSVSTGAGHDAAPSSRASPQTQSASGAAATTGTTPEGLHSRAGPNVIDVRGLLRRRLDDERALVRRAAAQAVAALIGLYVEDRHRPEEDTTQQEARLGQLARECKVQGMASAGLDTEWEPEILKLRQLCADVSVATRKAAATGLSSLLLLLPQSPLLQQTWVDAVLPLAHDSEASVQHRCSELVREAVLDRVRAWERWLRSSGAGQDPAEFDHGRDAGAVAAVWGLLARAASAEAQRCLQSALWPVSAAASSSAAPPALCCGVDPQTVVSALRLGAILGRSNPGAAVEGGREAARLGDKAPLETATAASIAAPDRRTLRQGTWVLFEALLCPAGKPGASGSPAANGTGPWTSEPPAVDATFMISCWHDTWADLETAMGVVEVGGHGVTFKERTAAEVNAQRVLRVMARLAAIIPAADASALAAELLALLQARVMCLPSTLCSLSHRPAPTPQCARSMERKSCGRLGQGK